MPTDTHSHSATPAQAANTSAAKNCPVAQGGRGMGRTFCSKPCKTGFHARMKGEGGPLAALVKAWTQTRHAEPGSREAEICRFARSQITQIAAHFCEQDASERRPSAVDYVETLMASGITFMDKHKR